MKNVIVHDSTDLRNKYIYAFCSTRFGCLVVQSLLTAPLQLPALPHSRHLQWTIFIIAVASIRQQGYL